MMDDTNRASRWGKLPAGVGGCSPLREGTGSSALRCKQGTADPLVGPHSKDRSATAEKGRPRANSEEDAAQVPLHHVRPEPQLVPVISRRRFGPRAFVCSLPRPDPLIRCALEIRDVLL
jgi:hypothetical protein